MAGTVAVAAVAAVAVAVGIGLGWRGVDLPAQLYRVELFHRHGFALWDSQWFGGHWLLDYSVVFPALAATLGVATVTVASAAAAAAAFDRLLVEHFAPGVRPASVVFALGLCVESAIGQLTFLLGEAAGLWCLLLVARRRWVAAALLGAAASLSSPLDGAFVALAIVASWAVGPGSWAQRWREAQGPAAVLAAVAAPVGVTSLLFPGQGAMPYPVSDYLWELLVAALLLLLTTGRDRVLRAGLALYALALTVSAAIPSPLGGNIGRLEDTAALPLAVALMWPPRRPLRRIARPVLLAAVVPALALSQWSPAWAAMTTNDRHAWTHRAYYQPLTDWLVAHAVPVGRAEVVPTLDHWEAAYVAPSVALARGWERQLDVADNPLFYRAGGPDATQYLAWLRNGGVRYVALADAPVDPAGAAEAALLGRGVAGLHLVWASGGWRVWAVQGSTGLAGAGARIVSMGGSRVTVALARAGTVVIRVRYTPGWTVDRAEGHVAEAPGRWLALTVPAPGTVTLRLTLHIGAG